MQTKEAWGIRSARGRYGLAVLSVIAAAAWMFAWQRFGQEPAVAPFLLAILVTGWYAGAAPVLVATVLSALVYAALASRPAPIPGWELGPHLAWFLIFAGVTAWFSAARRRISERLEQARSGLEEEVLTRTAALRRNEEILLAAQRMSRTGNWSWDVASGKFTWSDECARIFGRDPTNITRSRLHEIWHPDDRAAAELSLTEALREKKPYDRIVRAVRPNGEVRFMHCAGRPVLDESGDVIEYMGVMMDITDLEEAEEQARLAKEEATEARFAAILDERARLARELHDTLLQGFTGVGLKLVAVTNRVAGPPETVAALREVIASAQSTLENARRAIWDIRLSPSDGDDFLTTLCAAAEEGVRGTGVALDFSIEGARLPVNLDVEAAVLRVAQEAISNVVKYAAARTVRLVLTYEPRAIRLAVADDGRGFVVDPNFHSYRGHLGLLGMKERASHLQGTLEITSSPESGTKLVLTVPCARFAADRPPAAPPQNVE